MTIKFSIALTVLMFSACGGCAGEQDAFAVQDPKPPSARILVITTTSTPPDVAGFSFDSFAASALPKDIVVRTLETSAELEARAVNEALALPALRSAGMFSAVVVVDSTTKRSEILQLAAHPLPQQWTGAVARDDYSVWLARADGGHDVPPRFWLGQWKVEPLPADCKFRTWGNGDPKLDQWVLVPHTPDLRRQPPEPSCNVPPNPVYRFSSADSRKIGYVCERPKYWFVRKPRKAGSPPPPPGGPLPPVAAFGSLVPASAYDDKTRAWLDERYTEHPDSEAFPKLPGKGQPQEWLVKTE